MITIANRERNPVDPSKECTFDHNDWFPDWPGKGAGDLSLDPKFVSDPSASLRTGFERAKAVRLAKDSPCIDQGVDAGLPFAGAAPDLGAFEVGLFETNPKF